VYFNDPSGLVGSGCGCPPNCHSGQVSGSLGGIRDAGKGKKAKSGSSGGSGGNTNAGSENATLTGAAAQSAVMGMQGGVNQGGGGGTGHPTVASVAEQVYWSGQKYDGNSSIGQVARQVGLEQNYLGDFAPEVGGMFAGLMQSGELDDAEVTQLAQLRTETVARVKTQYLMGVFSPNNVGSILLLAGASLGQPYQGRVLQMVRRYMGIGGRSEVLQFPNAKKLQAKFDKHRLDFGVSGGFNQANAAKFRSAINQHVNAPGTIRVIGRYRNANNPAVFYLNPRTGLNVVASPSGQFITGAKLSVDQIRDILTKGFLW
jgi:hypothetical protein